MNVSVPGGELLGTSSHLTLKTEICVIGSGAGGAVVAHSLAQNGFEVTLLEAGNEYPSRFFKKGFTEFEIFHQLYYGGGLQSNANQDILVLQGRAIGGSTLVNHAVCYRLPDEIAVQWSEEHRLEEKNPQDLKPFFEQIERVLHPSHTPTKNMNRNN